MITLRMGNGCEVFNFKTYESFKQVNKSQGYTIFQRLWCSQNIFHDKYAVLPADKPKTVLFVYLHDELHIKLSIADRSRQIIVVIRPILTPYSPKGESEKPYIIAIILRLSTRDIFLWYTVYILDSKTSQISIQATLHSRIFKMYYETTLMFNYYTRNGQRGLSILPRHVLLVMILISCWSWKNRKIFWKPSIQNY